MAQSLKVAVIGAGPAGLMSARELQYEGHEVVVYEQANQISGQWLYDPRVEDDTLGINPNRKIIHGSVYYSLQTHIPRCLMGFPDYPFPPQKNGHMSNYPGHAEVLEFLKGFVHDFGLEKLIKLNTQIVRVEQVVLKEKMMWIVESKRSDVEDDDLSTSLELFEAVVVCNGHNTQPKSIQLPGINEWPGNQIHSHNYRVPEPYRNHVIVMIGSGSSAYQICEQVSSVAKEVHLVSRWPGTIPSSKVNLFQNVWLHCKVDYCYKNGEVSFDDGASVIAADTILYCTGYKYNVPFLKRNESVKVDNNRVGPLYKHVFSSHAPTLSFVGIPTWAPVFVMVYLQAKWVAQVLSGKTILPTKQEMMDDVEKHYQLMEQNGIPKHHTHSLSSNAFDYLDWLCCEVGVPNEVEMREIFDIFVEAILTNGFWYGFRDYIDTRISLTIKPSPKSTDG